MIGFRSGLVAMLIGGALFSRPAAAQYGDNSMSLTHVVTVTVPSRVKVRLSPLSMSSGTSAPAAVKVSQSHSATGIGLSVRATKAWVLSIRAVSGSKRAAGSPLHWSSSPKGEYKALTSADTVLVAGDRTESSADTAVFFQNAKGSSSNDADSTIFLTVAAP
jgi:hypothetical protein